MGIRCDFCDYHIFHKTKRPTKGLNVINKWLTTFTVRDCEVIDNLNKDIYKVSI